MSEIIITIIVKNVSCTTRLKLQWKTALSLRSLLQHSQKKNEFTLYYVGKGGGAELKYQWTIIAWKKVRRVEERKIQEDTESWTEGEPEPGLLTYGAPGRLLLPPRHVCFAGPGGEFFSGGPGDPSWPGEPSKLWYSLPSPAWALFLRAPA